jgi:transcriptional regulator with XRE-family HTH domain
MATRTSDQLAAALGEQLRALRLRQNTDQRQLAARAGVALNAVKNLESGRGGTTRSLLKVLRALGREDWLDALAPRVSISPLQALAGKPVRRRASRERA